MDVELQVPVPLPAREQERLQKTFTIYSYDCAPPADRRSLCDRE